MGDERLRQIDGVLVHRATRPATARDPRSAARPAADGRAGAREPVLEFLPVGFGGRREPPDYHPAASRRSAAGIHERTVPERRGARQFGVSGRPGHAGAEAAGLAVYSASLSAMSRGSPVRRVPIWLVT
jgi:hypothetical protein